MADLQELYLLCYGGNNGHCRTRFVFDHAAGGMAHMTELANKRAAAGPKKADPLDYDYLDDFR